MKRRELRRGRWQRFCQRVAVFGIAALAGSAIGLAGLLGVANASDQSIVLQKFIGGEYSFSLVVDPCKSEACPLRVWLHHNGRIVDRFSLDIDAASQSAQLEPVDAVWGADAGLQAWVTGIEASRVSTVARTATVAPGKTGLLVTQNFGFEHRKRGHVFLMPVGDKLVAVWRYVEGPGPTWSATEVLPGNIGGPQEIVILRGFGEPAEGLPESLEATRLDADSSATVLRESALPDPARPLYLVRVDGYADSAAARQARLANGYCLGAYWVLDASRFPGVAGVHDILGRIYTRRDAADAETQATRECLPSVTPTVTSWTQTPRP